MNREICFDTETTGLDPLKGDRLIEIGCVELIDGRRTDNYFHELVNPEREVPEEATAIHGISTEQLQDKPKFSEIVSRLLDFFGDSTLVAHNATFDMNFINFELELAGYETLKNNVVDSLLIAKNKFPGQKNNLDALCRRFGIDNSARTFHGALLDAELLADVYMELNGGAQKSLLENQQQTEENVSETATLIPIEDLLREIGQHKILPSRNFRVSDEDREKHEAFLKRYIPNNLWDREK